jgi:iron complex transport system substrate-binding protein
MLALGKSGLAGAGRLAYIIGILGLAALLASACGSGGDGGEAKPAPTTAAATVDLTTDSLGRKVSPPVPARRVVAMSPSIVELMFAVGATPIGRPSSADFPEAARSVPDFGTSYDFSDEVITSMRPDLIIADAILHEAFIDRLSRLGAPVFAVRVGSFDEVVKALRVVGALTGNAAAGEREAKALEEKLAAVKAKVPSGGPTVAVLIGGRGPIYLAKNDSFAGDLLRLLGARNVIPTGPDTFQLPGFTEYSLERLVEQNPDVILVISPQPLPAPRTSETLARTPVWGALKAVQQGRVHEIDPAVYLQSAGPRVRLALDELPRLLYPSVFAAGAR